MSCAASWYRASCALLLLTLHLFMFSFYLPFFLSLSLPPSFSLSLPLSLSLCLSPSLYLCLSVVASHVSYDALYQAAQCMCMGCHMYPLLNQSYFSQLIPPYLIYNSPTIHRLFFTTTILRAAWKMSFSPSGQPSSSCWCSCSWSYCPHK